MRLFGLNINKFSNVKFEEAQSKNTIAVNMVHWGCKSGSLLKFLNDALLPINVNLSYENSVIMKSFIFIELDNFYEAYYAKNLLNNLIFQVNYFIFSNKD